jgi:hypothetical protein
VSRNFEIIQLKIDEASIRKLANRPRNQLVGCMHAHNELTVLNRILMFSMNNTGEGELHDSAQSVQMWTILQLLAGKLFETWNMLSERFLSANPEDPAVTALSDEYRASLDWLKDYFGGDRPKDNALRTIRDRAAFHYDKLNLTEAVDHLAEGESAIYLAQHPANSLYYLGSSLVFRTVFALIAKKLNAASGVTHGELVTEGFRITIDDAKLGNWHMHVLLYGLMLHLLESAAGRPLETIEQVRFPVVDAPDPDTIGLPTFIDIGP